MSSILLVVIGLGLFCFGWFIYSKFVAEKILGTALEEDFVTPAHEFRDDVDFVPTNKIILWGHHFTTVAGAAPIVGPAIAVQWGWLPAFLWVVLGTVFFAGIHDMSALWASVKNKGKSIGVICTKYVGSLVGQLFMVVIFFVLLMVNAAFAIIIAQQSVAHPTTIIPAWGAIVLALIVGQCIYKFRLPLVPVTIVAVALLYALIPLGVAFPIELPESVAGLNPYIQWVVIMFIYAGIASILPVWMLLQPRDYINGIQLIICLILIYISILIVNPNIVAPSLIPAVKAPGGWHQIVPILFITVACGAISGFHGIASSGTTSKQINKLKDVRFVGYLGSVGEGSLALATIVCCIAGVSLAAATLPDLNSANWAEMYKGGAPMFVKGGGAIINEGIGLPFDVASTLLSLIVILFAATTMDSGVRLQRYIIQEWGEMYNIGFLRGKTVATLTAVISSLALALSGVGDGTGTIAIWPLFGATNQLLASLILLVISVILIRSKKFGGSLVTLIPMCFILTMALWGAISQLGKYYADANWLLVALNSLVIIVTILVLLTSLSVVSKIIKERS